MTIAIVQPDIVSIEDLFGRTLVYGGLSVAIVAIDLAFLAGVTALLGDALDQRQVVLLVLLLSAVLYGPLRHRLWRRCGGCCSATATTRTTPWPASPPRSRPPTRGRASWPPSPGRWRPRSASPSSASRSTGAAASG